MNNELAHLNNIVSEDGVFRKIFLESLTSSPTISSSSSGWSSKFIDVSIDTCIEYLRSKVSQQLSNDVLDKYKNFMEECAPSGRVNWKTFREASQRWIDSINPKRQDKNNNCQETNGEDTADSPDEGTTTDEQDILNKSFNDSGKSSEFVEWSILPVKDMANDTTSEFEKKDVSIKSPKGVDSVKISEAELRNRVRKFDEENVWLREELVRIEDLAGNYQRQFRSVRHKLDKIKEKYSQLERENDEQKEVIAGMEEQEKRFQVTLEKSEKETKSYVKEIEMSKQLISTLRAKIEKLTNSKINYSKQLSAYKKKLEEKEVDCEFFQDQLDQMTKLNNSLEDHYAKTIQNLQERNEELKNENFKLQSKLSSGNPSMEVSLVQSIHLNASTKDFSDEENNKTSLPDSLYAELRASGFSMNSSENNAKAQELEEELDWYNEEICKVIKQVDVIIEQLIQAKKLSSIEKHFKDACGSESKYIPVLVEKISVLSNIVTEAIQKPLTGEAHCQVFAQPLESRGLDEFQILSFKSDLSVLNIRPSSDSAQAFFTAPPVAFNQQSTEIQSRSIYTHLPRPGKRRWANDFSNELNTVPSGDQSRLEKRRWARNFMNDLNALLSGDSSMDTNSSLSSHSSSESKINFRPTVVVDDSVKKKEDEIANSSYMRKNSRESLNQNKSLSPIITTPKMSEKNMPRRKLSVFSRSIDMDKMLHPQCVNDILMSSTPDQPQAFSPTSYRTTVDLSDSSNSLSPSQLDTSAEEEKIDCHFMPTTRDTTTVIAPAKLTLPIQEDRTELNVPKKSNDSVTQVRGDMSACSDLFARKLVDAPKFCAYEIKNDVKKDIQAKKHPKSDITWIAQTDVDSSYHGRSSRAVNEKEALNPSAVTLAMSSGEDSSDSSNSEQVVTCDNKQVSRKIDNNITTNDLYESPGTPQSVTTELSTYSVWQIPRVMNGINDKTFTYKPSNSREIILTMKRSRSQSENVENHCSCNLRASKPNNKMSESNLMVFPSLADFRLQESGIANLSDSDEQDNDLSERDLEKKFLAFSLGLCTDRLTLARRRAFSLRQRDQTERNLASEVTRMSQNIEELAPLCFDSETIDRIERARNQVEIIAQCARKVSWAAELLGAIQQEHRISRAVYLTDKYLRMLRSRCEKLEADLAETKRILTENNILIDEHNVETGEELTIRYRGLPTANRTMIARRRASIATIFRPIVVGQDNTKEGVRQRNSVSGRVTVRRPSFSADSQRWEVEKLNKTESSNSVGELREIFEHIESRRASKEENNNIMLQITTNSEGSSSIVQTTVARSYNTDELPVAIIDEEEPQPDSRTISRISFMTGSYPMSWRSIVWCIVISFLIGFYMKDVLSSRPCSEGPFRWWTLEEILGRHVERRSSAPLPI